jgi:hypothetical protein
MRDKSLLTWLLVAAGAVTAVLTVVFLTSDARQNEQLRLELGKGLIQLLVVVLFGAALKLLLDRYQEQQLCAEQRREFRREKYDQVVQATNQLRRVPVLIEADRSLTTWSEQMLVVLDTGLTLRTIKHQISSSTEMGDFPFPNNAELVFLFEFMYRYTDWVAKDFADNRDDIAVGRRRGGMHRLLASSRSRGEELVWTRIKQLPSVADLLRPVNAAEREACRDALRDEMAAAVTRKGKRPCMPRRRRQAHSPTWLAYQEAHSLALEEIARSRLGGASTAGRG